MGGSRDSMASIHLFGMFGDSLGKNHGLRKACQFGTVP